MEQSVFTKIINGDIPCHKIYEDEKTLAFLDIHPVQPGMVLVVPKTQIDHFMDLAEEDYAALMATVKRVALHMHDVFPSKRVGVQIEGLDVAHAHIKMFPIGSGEEFRAKPDFESEPDHLVLSEMAKRLAF